MKGLKHRKSLLEIHLATLFFGLAGLFGKWIALSPFLIVLGRVFFASLTLGILVWARKQSLRAIYSRHAALLVLLGEVPTLRTLAGGAVILTAVLFVTLKEGSRRPG